MRRTEMLFGLVLVAAPMSLIWTVAGGSVTVNSAVVAAWIIASFVAGVRMIVGKNG